MNPYAGSFGFYSSAWEISLIQIMLKICWEREEVGSRGEK
jgi:hypothetical protein